MGERRETLVLGSQFSEKPQAAALIEATKTIEDSSEFRCGFQQRPRDFIGQVPQALADEKLGLEFRQRSSGMTREMPEFFL